MESATRCYLCLRCISALSCFFWTNSCLRHCREFQLRSGWWIKKLLFSLHPCVQEEGQKKMADGRKAGADLTPLIAGSPSEIAGSPSIAHFEGIRSPAASLDGSLCNAHTVHITGHVYRSFVGYIRCWLLRDSDFPSFRRGCFALQGA